VGLPLVLHDRTGGEAGDGGVESLALLASMKRVTTGGKSGSIGR
jgi:hypothetical protein